MRLQFNFLHITLVILLAALFAGCASIERPETPRQTVAYGYAAVQSAVDTVAIAYRNRAITDNQRVQAHALLRQARDYVVDADELERIYAGTRSDEVQSLLSRALAITQSIQSMICEDNPDEC